MLIVDTVKPTQNPVYSNVVGINIWSATHIESLPLLRSRQTWTKCHRHRQVSLSHSGFGFSFSLLNSNALYEKIIYGFCLFDRYGVRRIKIFNLYLGGQFDPVTINRWLHFESLNLHTRISVVWSFLWWLVSGGISIGFGFSNLFLLLLNSFIQSLHVFGVYCVLSVSYQLWSNRMVHCWSIFFWGLRHQFVL